MKYVVDLTNMELLVKEIDEIVDQINDNLGVLNNVLSTVESEYEGKGFRKYHIELEHKVK